MGGLRRGAGTLRNGVAESGLRLRIGDLVDGSPIARNSCRRVKIGWTNSYTGKGSGAVFVEVEAWDDTGTVRLRLALPDHATGRATLHDQVIGIEGREMPRGGGVAWSFVCPRTRNLVRVLHCPSGASSFAGRRAFRLSYRSQRWGVRDRPLERARKARAAMGDTTGNLTLPLPDKPRWMRWATYDRLHAKAASADRASLAVHAAWLDAIRPGWRNGARSA